MSESRFPFRGVDTVQPRHHQADQLQAIIIYERDLDTHEHYLRHALRQAQTTVERAHNLHVRALHRIDSMYSTAGGYRFLGGLLKRLLRARHRDTARSYERRRDLAIQRLDQLTSRHEQVIGEQQDVAAWLDERIDPTSPAGCERQRAAEAARRSPDPPSWVRVYASVDDYVATYPHRVLRRTPTGSPVLDGIDFGFHWRRDLEDDWSSPLHPVGRWRVSYLPGSGEVYALPNGTGARPVWSFGPRFDSEAHAAEVFEGLFDRINERNSLLLVAATLADQESRDDD